MTPPTLLYYVSGHGYGHAVRSGLVLDALAVQAPEVRLIVRTNRPAWLFPNVVELHAVDVDVGMIQEDSLTPRIEETIEQVLRFEDQGPALLERELRFCADTRPTAIVSDIPPLAFDVANALGIPSIAIGNFAWDWIYANLGLADNRLPDLVTAIQASESRATHLLRLPLHGEMTAFPSCEDIPLIAKRSRADRAATRQMLGVAAGVTLVLLSFGGHELDRLDYAALAHLTPMTFVVTSIPREPLPDNVVVARPDPATYHDLLAACDVVVMKPGYGTVADCLVNHVPMVYASRPGFVEETVLVPAMHTLGRAVSIAQSDLITGNLGAAVRAALALDTPWGVIQQDGAAVAARRVLEIAGLRAQSTR